MIIVIVQTHSSHHTNLGPKNILVSNFDDPTKVDHCNLFTRKFLRSPILAGLNHLTHHLIDLEPQICLVSLDERA